ncbi:MAG: hypothetical protein WCE21_01395 [Candidatus Babeliales bacterium]
MKIVQKILITTLFLGCDAHASESSIVISNAVAPVSENLVALHGASVVNFGVYTLVNKLKSPAIIIFGTEAAILVTLSCASGSSAYECIASFVSPESARAVVGLALENISMGIAYSVGERLGSQITVPQATMLLTALGTTGLGFYSWATDPSAIAQSMMLSAASAIFFTALTTAELPPALRKVKEKISRSLEGVSTHIGKVIGVATIAAGTAALVCPQAVAKSIFKSITNVVTSIDPYAIGRGVRKMIHENHSWIQGYRWGKNWMEQWSY